MNKFIIPENRIICAKFNKICPLKESKGTEFDIMLRFRTILIELFIPNDINYKIKFDCKYINDIKSPLLEKNNENEFEDLITFKMVNKGHYVLDVSKLAEYMFDEKHKDIIIYKDYINFAYVGCNTTKLIFDKKIPKKYTINSLIKYYNYYIDKTDNLLFC